MDFTTLLPTLVSSVVSAGAATIVFMMTTGKQIAILETKVDMIMEQVSGLVQLGTRVSRLEWRVDILEEETKKKG